MSSTETHAEGETAGAAPTGAPAAAASSSTPVAAAASIPDGDLTPDQLRAKKMFERWQKTFLGAIEKQSEEHVIAQLREGEDLIQAGLIDLNRAIKPASGSTFLHTGAWFLKFKIVTWLLQHGANPNQGNLNGNTPVHLLCERAAMEGAPQLLQLMIDYGGDIHIKDGGENPQSAIEKAQAVGFDVTKLSFAAHNAYVARMSGEAGGSPPQDEGMTEAEREAAVQKAKLVYRKLSTLFVGLDAEGVSQAVDDAIIRILTANLPLIHARILDVAAPPLVGEGNEKTFLHYAVIARRPEIVKVLLLALTTQGELDAQDESGDTALHAAMSRIDEGDHGPAIVLQLLEAGASTTVANYLKGLTPLQVLPPSTTPETKAWVNQQAAKPGRGRLATGTLASKLLGGAHTRNASGGGGVPLTPSAARAGGGPTNLGVTGGTQKQDRDGARALIARMAQNVGTGLPGMGGSMTTGGEDSPMAPTPKSGALGLIQKTAHNLGASALAASRVGGVGGIPGGGLGLNPRASGGPGLSAALQQIMAAKHAAAGGGGVGGVAAVSSSGLGIPPQREGGLGRRVGVGGGGGGVLHEKSLRLDAVFDMLDLSGQNSLTPGQVLALYEELNPCHTCTPQLVAQVLESVVPIHQCTRANFLEVMAALEVLAREQAEMRWDWRLMDYGETGALSTLDGTAGYTLSPAEFVWQANHTDGASGTAAVQTKYEDFLARRTKLERARPKEVRYTDYMAELTGKLPNLG